MGFERLTPREKRKLSRVKGKRWDIMTGEFMNPHRRRDARTGAILDDHPAASSDYIALRKAVKNFFRQLFRRR